MKKILSATLACLLLVGMVLVLASCGGIKGTYVNEDLEQTLTFKGDTLTMEMEDYTIEFTYELNKDEDEITLTVDKDSLMDLLEEELGDMFDELDEDEIDDMLDEYAEMFEGEFKFKMGDDYIKIDGTKYEKE